MSTPPDTAPSTAAVLPTATARLEDGIARRLHRGAQLCVHQGGAVVAELAVGEARDGVAMRADTLMPWLSSVKPVTAVAVARLAERGALALDDAVARHLPEFAAGGKGGVTLRHLLSHSGGFRTREIGGPRRSWEENLARICARPLEDGWVPGETFGYHPVSSWYVLGEVIRRVTGELPSRHLRRHVLEPLGMADSRVGTTPEEYHHLAPRLAAVWRTGSGEASAAAMDHRFPWDTEPWVARESPAENGWGPMRDLAELYAALLAGGGAVLAPASVAELVRPQREDGAFDRSLQRVVHWGLGLRVHGLTAERRPSGGRDFGPHAALGTYGHGGFRSSVAFADPGHGLVVALAVNGIPDARLHRRRFRDVVAGVYADLGLASQAGTPAAGGRGVEGAEA
ncbi:MAG TPA: serine hydrolase domain-containing protein [Thermoanaerobaculia bacterium]|nr:serine hydrolase domain-containing protein [Thermoanaerobaculia bacterium]